MTLYLKQQERKRQQIRQQKQQQQLFKEKEDAMYKSITHVSCRFIPNCNNNHSKQACAPCRRNMNHVPTPVPIDNYKEKIAGLKFL
jgi:hypothetical protein